MSKFSMYHPNMRGSGSAMTMELFPACDGRDGYIEMVLADQVSIGDPKQGSFPRFDFDNAVRTKLGFDDISEMLAVFRGEQESIRDEAGIRHCKDDVDYRIAMEHALEPKPGYRIHVYVSRIGAKAVDVGRSMFIPYMEALGLSLAIEHSIGVMCFGTPAVGSSEGVCHG